LVVEPRPDHDRAPIGRILVVEEGDPAVGMGNGDEI
jgi:hypothetical protein